MKLREDRPYGIVYGHTKIAYEQDGHQFGPDKQMLEGPVPDDPVQADSAKTPDPARSAKMKAIWAQKRAEQAAQAGS